MISPKITLVGAGPGDPELITLKGLKAIQAADVILYDALIGKDLLLYAKPEALQIYVGKRLGVCAFSQEEINHLMIQSAFDHGHVVRLKGGDPFVFGRGFEEVAAAKAFNIPVEVIPGISSSIAVPASQMIPVTARGTNESFWVTTGTTSKGDLSHDIRLAAQSTATVIVLMAMSKLKEILAVFESAGKQELPVAIIMNGTTANEKIVVGKVNDIAEKAEKAGLTNPAVIILGEVARLHPEFLKTYAMAERV